LSESGYQAVLHGQKTFLEEAMKREGFKVAYEELEEEYSLVSELLAARSRADLTQYCVKEECVV
jgi:hypothetical protein